MTNANANEERRRIAVFRALKLGDMLCAVPSFRALRGTFPTARIVLVGLPWAQECVDRYRAYIDEFREFPGYPGLPEREPEIDRLPNFFRKMQQEHFDLAIQMHGSGRISNQVVSRFGAAITAGFHEPDGECPNASTFLQYPKEGLEIRRLLSLMEHLGIPARGEALEFPIRPADNVEAQRLAREHGLALGESIVIHPGASVPERCWPPERFARVADALARRGHPIVLTGTTGEAGLTRAVARAMQAPAVNLAGRTPLGTLAALLNQARLLVCNDTGVSHLAAALGVPSVVISTGDNPARWAPIDGLRHRVLCRDTGVRPEEVTAEADDLLDAPPRRTARARDRTDD